MVWPDGLPDSCECYYTADHTWRPECCGPATWTKHKRRWPIPDCTKPLKQELLDLLERTCNGCFCIEISLTESCEECGRRDVCKDYRRLLELRGELNATSRIET